MKIFHEGSTMKSTPSALAMAGVGLSSGPKTLSTKRP